MLAFFPPFILFKKYKLKNTNCDKNYKTSDLIYQRQLFQISDWEKIKYNSFFRMREIQDGYEYILGPHNQPPPGEIHMFEISGETVTISPILDSEEETLKALDEKRKTVFGKNTPDADAQGFLVRSPKKTGQSVMVCRTLYKNRSEKSS